MSDDGGEESKRTNAKEKVLSGGANRRRASLPLRRRRTPGRISGRMQHHSGVIRGKLRDHVENPQRNEQR
eukprot:9488984-Pyramimonas_sp.AAC.1